MTIIEISHHRRGTHMAKNYVKRRRPHDPAERARKAAEEAGTARARDRARKADPSQWGVDTAALNLPANGDVVTAPAVAGKVARIRRFDVFALMHSRDGITSQELASVRRLQEAIAVLHQTAGARDLNRVDGGEGGVTGLAVARLEAGEEIAEVTTGVGHITGQLIMALCIPEMVEGRRVDWRGVVRRITGEIYPHGQAALVRVAVGNLARAYTEFDNRPKPKRRAA